MCICCYDKTLGVWQCVMTRSVLLLSVWNLTHDPQNTRLREQSTLVHIAKRQAHTSVFPSIFLLSAPRGFDLAGFFCASSDVSLCTGWLVEGGADTEPPRDLRESARPSGCCACVQKAWLLLIFALKAMVNTDIIYRALFRMTEMSALGIHVCACMFYLCEYKKITAAFVRVS